MAERGTAVGAVAAALDRIDADGREGIWITVADRDRALAAAEQVDQDVADGAVRPLAGRTLAVKDNIDVLGFPTTAACPAFAHQPAGTAPAVAALVAAGAVVVGKTNLDQFATGLVGTRSPYGTCPNAHWPPLVSGGSSSGSAVAVASGLVDLALGTDTAGSGRVPAAANGIVGLKPTRGWISTKRVVPAMPSLDCVSVFATTVAEASAVAACAGRAFTSGRDPGRRVPPHGWLAPPPAGTQERRARPIRIGVPRAFDLDFDGDPLGPRRWAMAVARLLHAVGTAGDRGGPDVVEVELGPFRAVADLLYGSALVRERYDAFGAFVDHHPDEVDPVVRTIVTAAGRFTEAELRAAEAEVAHLATCTEPVWGRIDALVVPTVPRLPTVAEVQAQPVAVNAMLGTYTNFVNLLDLAALTVPVLLGEDDPAPDGPPPSVTVVGPAWSDPLLARLAGTLA